MAPTVSFYSGILLGTHLFSLHMSSSLGPLYCLVAAAVLIYVPFMVVALARLQVGYDFSAPRAMLTKLPAYAQRAAWAHENSFESFTIFAAAVLMVFATGKSGELATSLSVGFLAFRVAYSISYIANVPILRSLSWGGGMLCIAGLMAIALNFWS